MLKIIFYLGLLSVIFPVGNYALLNVLFVSVGLILIVFNIYKQKKFSKILFNGYTLLLSVWLIWGLASYFWVKDYTTWSRYNTFIFLGLGYTLIISYILADKESLKGIFNVILFSLFIHNIIGFFEIFTGRYYFTSNESIKSIYSLLGYPTSFFYNTNDYATFLLFGIVLLAFYRPENEMKKNKRKVLNCLRYSLIISTLYLVVATDSRIIILTSIGVILLALYLNLKMKNIKIFIIPIAIGVLIYSIYLFTANVDMLAESLREDPSGNTRLILIRNGLDLLKLTNYRGVGSGNLEYYLSSYQNYGVATIFTLHNWWVEVLSTYGLIFFVVYIIFYIRKLLYGYKLFVKKNDNAVKVALVWLLAFLPGAMVSSSIFDEIWIWVINAIVFVILSSPYQNIIDNSNSKEVVL